MVKEGLKKEEAEALQKTLTEGEPPPRPYSHHHHKLLPLSPLERGFQGGERQLIAGCCCPRTLFLAGLLAIGAVRRMTAA